MRGGSLAELFEQMDRKGLPVTTRLRRRQKAELSLEPEPEPRVWEEHYPEVSVFITRSHKFRAKVRETKGGISYEVTVGGQKWDGIDPVVKDMVLAQVKLLFPAVDKELLQQVVKPQIQGGESNELS